MRTFTRLLAVMTFGLSCGDGFIWLAEMAGTRPDVRGGVAVIILIAAWVWAWPQIDPLGTRQP